jgi:Zn ribbon nucleic-acid-binding protein
MDRCPLCSGALAFVTAGLDWLFECTQCGHWERLTDEEMEAMAQ